MVLSQRDEWIMSRVAPTAEEMKNLSLCHLDEAIVLSAYLKGEITPEAAAQEITIPSRNEFPNNELFRPSFSKPRSRHRHDHWPTRRYSRPALYKPPLVEAAVLWPCVADTLQNGFDETPEEFSLFYKDGHFGSEDVFT